MTWNRQVAVKYIPKDRGDVCHGVCQVCQDLEKEFNLMRNLDHDNIMRCLGHYNARDLHPRKPHAFGIVLEHMAGG